MYAKIENFFHSNGRSSFKTPNNQNFLLCFCIQIHSSHQSSFKSFNEHSDEMFRYRRPHIGSYENDNIFISIGFD